MIMTLSLPQLGQPLSSDHLKFLQAFSKSCRRSIVEMTKNAQSGHPGGSLSCIDYLSLLYTFVIGQTGEKVVVSNGHISPAVYSVLAGMGYINKEEAVAGFRKIGAIYEGHVTRHVAGVEFGTGPLGIGVSAAAGMAWSEKRKGAERVYALVGDGESQEGQAYEMAHFAAQYKLDNFIVFMDYNQVQLSDSTASIMAIDFEATFTAAGWHVITVDAHDFSALWEALNEAHGVKGKPVLLLGHSVMGKGIDFMEKEGAAHKATWHGNAPKPGDADRVLASEALILTKEEVALVKTIHPLTRWKPKAPKFPKSLSAVMGRDDKPMDMGTPRVYGADESFDCRTAYGKALLDLAELNPEIVALTADLRASVMTKFVYEKFPERHVDVGIAEQHMVSCSGGMSLDGFIPFCSTFGAFMTSRAKDQARVNDINRTNVKMVATHCGLSVGEDGPTHQVIDDMGSMLGLLNTMVIEPADPNQTDLIIRYVAAHYGNFYVRMGRHKFPVLLKEDGSPYYGADYVYEYGKCDVIRAGNDVTVAASGAMVSEALKAIELLKKSRSEISVELVAVSSIKQFDETLMDSIEKTRRVVTVEDHNTRSGLGSQLARELMMRGMKVEAFTMMGVEAYQLSGKWNELYAAAGLSPEAIAGTLEEVLA